jgi:hypothetical protein
MFNFLRSDDPYARGFRDGLRGILAIGRYDAAPPGIRMTVGSPATDRLARYRDMEAFKADVDRGRRDVVYE